MTRGEMWLAQVGPTTRPVLNVRPEVIDVRCFVTVAEVTTSVRGLAAEVAFDHEAAGLEWAGVINDDGPHAIARSPLTRRVGTVGEATMSDVC